MSLGRTQQAGVSLRTYVLQGCNGCAFPSVVRVTIHVKDFLSIHRHDPREDAFLRREETRRGEGRVSGSSASFHFPPPNDALPKSVSGQPAARLGLKAPAPCSENKTPRLPHSRMKTGTLKDFCSRQINPLLGLLPAPGKPTKLFEPHTQLLPGFPQGSFGEVHSSGPD